MMLKPKMAIEEPIWVDQVKNSIYDLEDLPKGIENEIIDYLKLEYASDNKEFLLNFVGVYNLWEKPIMCWDYGSDDMFVTVQPYGASYCIALTSKDVAN